MATIHTVRDWLGHAAAETTVEQQSLLVIAFSAIEARWPDPDDQDDVQTALTAAVQVVLGDDTLEAYGAALAAARGVEHRCMVALTGALLVSDGSERALMDRSGVARETVRRALGK